MTMQSLEASLQQILAVLPAATPETIPLKSAAGRFLLDDCFAAAALPGFDNSAMDGYALRAAEVAGAAADHPVTLKLQGRVAAGEVFTGELAAGACIRLFTGSPVPRGADAVVMQEDTRIDPARPGEVSVIDAVKPWENVRFQGEDIKPGALAVPRGVCLNAGRLSLLAAIGVSSVRVGRRPVVGLLATGNELREIGQPLGSGQIYESNRISLAELVMRVGGLPRSYPLVADTLAATRAALEATLAECDVVITSGGVSVGEFDFVKSAFTEAGGQMDFWRVAIKPGRPFVFGRRQGKFLFGLPGNPISALVTFLLLVRPALLRWQGAQNVALPAHPGILAEPLVNRGNRRHFIRVAVDAAGQVRPAGVQASHILSPLAQANGLVDMPPETTHPAGTTVPVMRWEFTS